MTAILVVDFKLAIFVLLVVSVIGLSHLSGENLSKMKRELFSHRRHDFGRAQGR